MRRPAKGQRILFISEQKQKAHRLPNVWHPDKGRADCSLFYTSLSFQNLCKVTTIFGNTQTKQEKFFNFIFSSIFATTMALPCQAFGKVVPTPWQSFAKALEKVGTREALLKGVKRIEKDTS